MRTVRGRVVGVAGCLVAAGLLAAGCGSSDEDSATTLKMSISEQGKSATFKAPKTAESGLVDVKLTNNGKQPHGLQLIRYTGGHTMDDVLKELGKNSDVIPPWAKLDGGIGSVAGGKTGSATINLPEGNYVLVDAAALGGGGPPATAGIKLSGGSSGSLPDTPGQITAATAGHDEFKWEISGLTSGTNRITFTSKGKDTVHFVLAAPVKGKAPALSQIKKDFASNGPPPAYLDTTGIQSTAILDGGLSQTASLDLKKPGQYIFFCPLTDRDGKGKPHDQEGLLSVENVN
jgi:hypothetical protein